MTRRLSLANVTGSRRTASGLRRLDFLAADIEYALSYVRPPFHGLIYERPVSKG